MHNLENSLIFFLSVYVQAFFGLLLPVTCWILLFLKSACIALTFFFLGSDLCNLLLMLPHLGVFHLCGSRKPSLPGKVRLKLVPPLFTLHPCWCGASTWRWPEIGWLNTQQSRFSQNWTCTSDLLALRLDWKPFTLSTHGMCACPLLRVKKGSSPLKNDRSMSSSSLPTFLLSLLVPFDVWLLQLN